MFSDETLDGFRRAVRARVEGEPGGSERLSSAVRSLAAEARAAAVTAEHLVIRIKEEWDALVKHGPHPMPGATGDVRDRIITTAIRAYYVQ
jgi:hypothetical protein